MNNRVKLIFVVIAQYIDKEAILLGAFLAGLLLSIFMHKERSLLLIKLDGMGYGFFIPVFFIMVGAQFDPVALSEFDNTLIPFLILMLFTLYLVKVFPSLLWSGLFGIKKALSGGFLMSTRLSLIIAASQIGLELGVISPGLNSCFILMAVITCLISPVIFNLLNPAKLFEREKTIIVGGSSAGVLLSRRLKMHEKSSVIIEKDEARHREMKLKGLETVMGDGKDRKVYEKLGLDPINYVVVLTGSDKENVKVCKILRKDFRHERIITKAGTQDFENKLRELQADALDVTRIMATTIENLILRPVTYHALVETLESFNLEEVTITKKELEGKQVQDLPFHKDGALLLIKRGDEMIIPHGQTYFQIGDIITVFGTETALETIKAQLS